MPPLQAAELTGAPAATRTRDPLLRRQMLYPTELRAQWCIYYGAIWERRKRPLSDRPTHSVLNWLA
jgi:hypothetical protein